MDRAQELSELAGATTERIKAAFPKADVGSRLTWAAWNLGGALAATGIVESLATEPGLDEIRRVLQVESYDVLEAAAVGLSASSAVSAIDLCAATAWTIQPGSPLHRGWEADLALVIAPKRKALLLPDHIRWVDSVSSSAEWRLVESCRNQARHRTFRRTIKLTVGAPRIPHDDFEVAGSMYPADDLVRQFAQDAERWFRQFCKIHE